jgi:scyllo-inositol 2-dehydrogenase (NADP+)
MSNPINEASRRFRVGVAGAGWVARSRHVPSILQRSDVDFISVYDRDPDRARTVCGEIATKSKGRVRTKAHSEIQSFLDDGLDVVHVTSSPWSHHDITISALESGAHVFLEKPMAMNEAQAQEMADKSVEVGRLLCVSHNFLWSRAMQETRHALRNCEIDYVMGLQMSAPTRRLPTWHSGLPGGLMFDEIPHMLYSIQSLLSGDLTLDGARARWDGESCPRTVEVLVKGALGNGQITMNFNSPVSEWHILASSPQKAVGIDLFRDISIPLKPDGAHGSLDILRTSEMAVSGHIKGFLRAGSRWIGHRQYWGHDTLINEFYRSIIENRQSPVPPQSALAIVRLNDQILQELGVQ